MSDIKIQPSATGSATVTLTAPATSTARTVTLPDGTGTLLNSDGSGANLTNLPNGSQLDHSGTKKIEATATGVSVTGASYSTSNIGLNVNNFLGFSDNSFGRLVVNDTEICRVLSTGGITFNGDTAAANALDDYEEGTWTPTGTNVSSTGLKGSYTKIGCYVWCQFWFQVSGGDTTSTIGGLPFTASNNVGNGAGGGAPIYNQDNIRGFLVSNNNTYFHIYGGANGDASKVVSNGLQVHGFLSYMTNDF